MDTWWFLKDFGPHSVGIGFGWGYQLYLGDWHGKINTQALSERMNSADYQVLRKTFGRVDIENAENRVNWMQKGDFYFGESSDGDIQIEELAWHAGHNTEKFVMQAKAKIEAFTQDEQMTYLLMKLNEEVRERLPSKRC